MFSIICLQLTKEYNYLLGNYHLYNSYHLSMGIPSKLKGMKKLLVNGAFGYDLHELSHKIAFIILVINCTRAD